MQRGNIMTNDEIENLLVQISDSKSAQETLVILDRITDILYKLKALCYNEIADNIGD
jgi:hypothetical protein